jgi:DNA-binding NarL/FixJ family response regulator
MRIVLADDRTRIRSALRVLLEQQADWSVVGEASNACELIDQTSRSHPDLIIMDGDLPGDFKADVIPKIRAIHPGIRIVALLKPDNTVVKPENARADAYATKVNSPEYLLAVIRSCLVRR